MFYPLDSRNAKKLKLNYWVFINNNRILVKLFQKSQNNNIIFYEKIQNNYIILGLGILVLCTVRAPL